MNTSKESQKIQKSVGLLLCKKGSKRLPNKNVLPYNGEPMYMTNLKKCLKIFDEVYISSDDEEILDRAEELGAVGILRSQNLCGDCPNIPVYHHAIGFMNPTKSIVAVQVNSPNINVEIISKVKQHMEDGAHEVMTCHTDGSLYGSVWGISLKKLLAYQDPYHPIPQALVVDDSIDIHTAEEYTQLIYEQTK